MGSLPAESPSQHHGTVKIRSQDVVQHCWRKHPDRGRELLARYMYDCIQRLLSRNSSYPLLNLVGRGQIKGFDLVKRAG